jgi:lysyl-tRNA synthetase class I
MHEQKIRTFAAFFLHVEHEDDQNIILTATEVDQRLSEAQKFDFAVFSLLNHLSVIDQNAEEEEFQTAFYDAGKAYFGHDKDVLRRFFSLIYMMVWRKTAGPRFGKFIKVFGINEFIELFNRRISDPFELEKLYVHTHG